MKLLNTAIIRLTLVLLAGTFTGFYSSLPLSCYLFLLAGCLCIFIFSFLRAKRLLLQDAFFGGSCLCLFFVLGMVSVQLHRPENQKAQYSGQHLQQNTSILVGISESLKPDSYREKYIAKVLQVNGSDAHGKLLLLLPPREVPLESGDRLLLASRLDSIPKLLNPQQFNYRKFMADRGILFQAAPSPAEYLVLPHEPRDLQQAAQGFRGSIIAKLRTQEFGKEELAIFQALLLGERRDLSWETNENFAAAGVMHILAVSGLHVGIILLLLNSLLFFLNRGRWGKLVKTLLLLLLLWGYALVAGLSPSIVRAVCMFSFLAVGMQLQRQTSVLNSLSLSLMFLLLLHPHWALDVGFQLSYLAVLFIIILQPLFYNLLLPRNRVLKYFWSLSTVSLAAQVGVLPLSLYYFHQFPGLFFLSNLVILPFLGILLGLGILVILLSMLDLLPGFLAQGYNLLIRWLNGFVEWIANKEDFLFRELQFSQYQLFAFYALLLSLILLSRGFHPKKLMLLLGSFICLQGVLIGESLLKGEDELIVFHRSRHTVLGQKQNRHLKLAHNLKDPEQPQAFLRNYKLVSGIRSQESGVLQNIYLFQDEWLVLVDSTSVFPVPVPHPKRILLTGSPQINLDRLLRDLRPLQIIADGSNYKSYVARWRETCRKKKIPFHYTGEKGAFILKGKSRARAFPGLFYKNPSFRIRP